MVPMAWVLPLRATRWVNIVAAPLFALTLIGLPGDLDDYFHVAVMLIALATVASKACSWERSASTSHALHEIDSMAEKVAQSRPDHEL